MQYSAGLSSDFGCACMQVVPDKIGDKYSTYNDFICALPDGQCRYAGTSRGGIVAAAAMVSAKFHLGLQLP